MAKRPINVKAANRVRKAFRTPLEGYINPVRWLRDRGHAQTAGEARKIILAKRLKINSHPVGLAEAVVEEADGTRVKQTFVVDIPVKEFHSGVPTVVPA